MPFGFYCEKTAHYQEWLFSWMDNKIQIVTYTRGQPVMLNDTNSLNNGPCLCMPHSSHRHQNCIQHCLFRHHSTHHQQMDEAIQQNTFSCDDTYNLNKSLCLWETHNNHHHHIYILGCLFHHCIHRCLPIQHENNLNR